MQSLVKFSGERRLTGKPPVSKTGTEGSSPSAPARLYQGYHSMNKAIQFIKDSVAELKKSTWLSRQEVIQSTILVGIVVVLVSAYVGLIDFGLTRLLGVVVGGN